jgi:hypothetical protein
MPDQLFPYYLANPLVIISINSGHGVGVLMVIRLDIEIYVIDKGGTKTRDVSRGAGGGRGMGADGFLWPLCMFWYISVVVKGASVRDCRRLGVFSWYSWLVSRQ